MAREKITIFIVEDDVTFNNMLSGYIRQMGNRLAPNDFEFVVHSFESGEECERNLHLHPQIVFLDYHLDGENPNAQNGMKTLKRIKAHNKETQVIVLSAQEQLMTVTELLKAGAKDYVPKDNSAFMRTDAIIQQAINDLGKQRRMRTMKLLTTVFLIIGLCVTAILFNENYGT